MKKKFLISSFLLLAAFTLYAQERKVSPGDPATSTSNFKKQESEKSSYNSYLGEADKLTAALWEQDIELLVKKIEQYHPRPWIRISREDFSGKVHTIKAHLKEWDNEKIIVELMKLVALLEDGHTELIVNNQDRFNLWFPVRIEKFHDGLFITATTTRDPDLLGAKVLKIGMYDSENAYQLISGVISRDSEHGIARRITNFIPNATILVKTGIIESNTVLPLEILTRDGSIKHVTLNSSEWKLSFGWAWDKKAVCTNENSITLYDDKKSDLPLYLSQNLSSPGEKYWFRIIPEDKMMYFQLNQIFNSDRELLVQFTQRLIKTFQEHIAEIDKIVIDLRFNEGGNGNLIKMVVQEFEKINDKIAPGKLFIITGNHTFSAACFFIAQMLKSTHVVTAGDIAGPINCSADPIMFVLPNSNLLINISRAFFQEGDYWDSRGYYAPDYYIPLMSKDYFSFADPVMEAIKAGRVTSLKNILLSQGIDSLLSEVKRREKANGPPEKWFPYSSYGLSVYASDNLFSIGKYEEAIGLAKLSTTIYPNEIWGWFLLGFAFNEMGKYSESLEYLNRVLAIEPHYAEVIWERDRAKAFSTPWIVDLSLFEKYQGDYGDLNISYENGKLFYQTDNNNKKKLTPISETYFIIENNPRSRIIFTVKNGIAEAMKIVRQDGRTSTYQRNRKQ